MHLSHFWPLQSALIRCWSTSSASSIRFAEVAIWVSWKPRFFKIVASMILIWPMLPLGSFSVSLLFVAKKRAGTRAYSWRELAHTNTIK